MSMNHPLGVTVMPEWFQCEGIGAVLDRVQSIGATAIATSPYVMEVAPDGEGARERLLQQRFAIGQVEERLRLRLARQRPQPRADAAGHDHWLYADLLFAPRLGRWKRRGFRATAFGLQDLHVAPLDEC